MDKNKFTCKELFHLFLTNENLKKMSCYEKDDKKKWKCDMKNEDKFCEDVCENNGRPKDVNKFILYSIIGSKTNEYIHSYLTITINNKKKKILITKD
jgi:hypothetical protein